MSFNELMKELVLVVVISSISSAFGILIGKQFSKLGAIIGGSFGALIGLIAFILIFA